MNQNTGVSARDATNKRRKYLLALAGTRIAFIASAALLIGSVLLMAGSIGVLAAALVYFGIQSDALQLSIGALAICGCMLYIGVTTAREAYSRASMLSVVPPVVEQVADHTAKGILVRGSDQPASELLRAADAGKSAPEDELLRIGPEDAEVLNAMVMQNQASRHCSTRVPPPALWL